MPTYTSTFHIRRKLYAIYDWELPWALEIPQVIAFVGGLILMILLLIVSGVRLGPSTLGFVLGVPVVLAWRAPMTVADGKQAHTWLAAQITYLCEPRVMHDLHRGPTLNPDRVAIRVTAWEPRRPAPALALPASAMTTPGRRRPGNS